MGAVRRFPQAKTGRFGATAEREPPVSQGTREVLDEWDRWQRAQGHSPNTITARRRRIELFAQMIGDPVTATTDDVIAYMASLPSGLVRSTRATYFSHLRAWFDWLVKTERRDDDPTIRVPAPKSPARKPRPVTEHQLMLILSTRMHARTRMMILLAAFQGLRVHEIAKIRGEDIDFTSKQLRVVGKGGVDRTLPLHPIVEEYAARFGRRGWWFPARDDDGHILSRSVSDITGDVLRRAGVPTGAAHRLRHTYATRLVQAGENLRVIQELLRHASLQTTQIYTGVTFEQQRAAIERLGMPEPDDSAA